MRLPGLYRLRRAAQRFRNRFRPTALILLYHRVIDLTSDPQLLCVTPKHFAEHLDILKKYARPVNLQSLNRSLQNEDLVSRSVVVTFDDGYADNLQNAKPLLERFNIPATVFVASGYVRSDHEFWWDELERLLLHPGTLPEPLRLSMNGNAYQWELKEGACYRDSDFQHYRSWNVLEKENPTSRQDLYRSLHRHLRPFPEKDRRNVLNELANLLYSESQKRTTHRSLSGEEIFRLDRDGLVEIGSHTVTHPLLSSLPIAEQQFEIQEGKTHLEEIVGHPLTSFAYPYGSKEDYTNETTTLVQRADFKCACSNFPDIVCRGTDRFQLPRVLVRDWDGETFTRLLEQWFLG